MTDETVAVGNVFPRDRARLIDHGAVAWLRTNLFPNPASSALTIVCALFVAYVVVTLVNYAVIDAVWSAPDGAACRAHQDGACWASSVRSSTTSATAPIRSPSAGAST